MRAGSTTAYPPSTRAGCKMGDVVTSLY